MITEIGINILQNINWVMVIIIATLIWVVGFIVTRLKLNALVIYYVGIIVAFSAIYINFLILR